MAPARAASSTSFTVVPACRPIALMSASGMGGVQVTSFFSTTLPLSTDFGLVGSVARCTSRVVSFSAVMARPVRREGWRTSPSPLETTHPAASTRFCVELGSRTGRNASCGPSSVSESITRVSAMPSAIAWWMRKKVADPWPNPEMKWTSHSGRVGSSGMPVWLLT